MITIRNYHERDYASVQKMLESEGMFDKAWDSPENLSGMIAHNPEAIIIAEENGDVVGTVFCSRYGSKVAWLFRLVVHKDSRGQGIGSQLLEYAGKIAKEQGITELGLYVDAENTELQEYYRKKGFSNSGKRWVYMWKDVQS